MGMTCKELFEGVEATFLGDPSEVVEGLEYRSDAVSPGEAFFCIVGTRVDGHSFAQDAIDRGAKVIVAERKVYLADATDVVEVIVADSRKAMAQAAANFHGRPSESLKLVGITGTNGKTTTTYLVEHIANVAGGRTGVVGTVGVRIGNTLEPGERTTPESTDLQYLFARMREANTDVVAMEVSSHALDLDRVFGTRFAVTAFTNLTQDHLDYHKTFEAYFEAKALLFGPLYPARRVINIDDQWGRELLKRCSEAGDHIISTGFSADAQIHPVSVDYAPAQTSVRLYVRGTEYEFSYPLVGRFNVSNIMMAFGIGLELGISAESIVSALQSAPQVPGRLERVKSAYADGVSVFVDYAHTPDALTKAISAVKSLSEGRTLVVFGCGGDRDSSKRPLMGKAALEADVAILTSDNPRSEDPLSIIGMVQDGMKGAEGRYVVEPDRRCAIARAIALAEPGDSILVAGKGHEDYQLVGTETLHFSDVEAAAEELEKAHRAAQDRPGRGGSPCA